MDPDALLSPEPAGLAADDSTSTGPADALTRLLEELARTPEWQIGQAWQKRLSPGEVVDRFELLREAGRGGFGVVFEARDTHLGRLVAFKALRPGRVLDEKQVESLRREAESAARLNNPNVVTVHDFGACPAGPYLIMEFLQGAPLSQRLEAGPLPPREAVRIAIGVAQALAHAHGAGVIHRDLKPGNVFLCSDGQVKVLDFGLARMLGASGVRGGTPGYMAPEQCRGEKEDERTDLFGLGALLYRMLTAKLPFAVVDGRSAALDDGPPPELPRKDISPGLSALVGRLLAKEPSGRPSSALEALDALVPIARALDPLVLARQRRRLLLAAALALLGAVGGTAAGLRVRFSGVHTPGQVTVAVADFANETGDPELDGLSGMLITSLEQSNMLSVLTRSRMRDELRQMGRADVPRIDEPMARELGRRLGTKTLLLASIHRLDGAYAVDMRALDPTRDRPLFSVSERARDKAGIPDLLDRISERTRGELREATRDVGASRIRVGEALTRNPKAYAHYALGVDCVDRASRSGSPWEACAGHFRAALAADPDFAMAYYQLAYLGAIELTDETEARRNIEAAAARSDGLPTKERHLILAWKAHVEGRDEDALGFYQKLLERFPEDKDALFLSGSILHLQGRLERAIPFMEKVLALDPTFDRALDYLPAELLAAGRLDDLRQHVARWEALPPSPGTLHALAFAEFGLGDVQGALATARRHVTLGAGTRGARDVAAVLFSSGDLRGAERELRAAIAAGSNDDLLPLKLVNAVNALGRTREALSALDKLGPWLARSGDEATYHYFRAVLLASSGDREGAWAAARAMAKIDPAIAAHLAVDLAVHGDLPHAKALAARLPEGSSRHEVWRAVADWKRGDVAGAKSRLRALDRMDPFADIAPMPSFMLAEVAADAGHDAEVVEAVHRYQSLWAPGAPGLRSGWTSPRALVLLARSELRLGRIDDARRTLDRFLALWSAADADHPLLREAKALQANLAGLAKYPARGSAP